MRIGYGVKTFCYCPYSCFVLCFIYLFIFLVGLPKHVFCVEENLASYPLGLCLIFSVLIFKKKKPFLHVFVVVLEFVLEVQVISKFHFMEV